MAKRTKYLALTFNFMYQIVQLLYKQGVSISPLIRYIIYDKMCVQLIYFLY